MAITLSQTMASVYSISGLTKVTDSVSLAGGGAAFLGSKYNTSDSAIELYSSTGTFLRVIDVPFVGVPKDLCQLSDGSLLLSFTVDAELYVARFGLNGSLIGEPLRISSDSTELVALANGGFMTVGGGTAQVYEPFGNGFVVDTTVNTGSPLGEFSATKLDNGNVAIVWSEAAGGDTIMQYAVFGPDGSVKTAPMTIDAFGTINKEPDIVATSEGFVAAYIDNGWTGLTEITLAYFNASGTFLGYQQFTVNAVLEKTPSLTRLDGGIAVSWVDETFGDSDVFTRIVSDTYANYGSVNFSANFVDGTSNDVEAPQTASVSSSSYITLANDLTSNTVRVAVTTRADAVTGDAANDLYVAKKGVEVIDLNGGSNTVSYATSTAGVLVYADGTVSKGGFAEGDTLFDVQNITGSAYGDRLIGDGSGNKLVGGSGNDTILGAGGGDVITGGLGRDVMRGGVDASVDVFVFNRTTETGKGSARDTIVNFVSGTDDIHLTAIDANSSLAGNQAFAFRGTTASAHAVWYKLSGSDVIVYGDVNGDKVSDFEILLKGVGSLVATDFLL